MGFFNLYFQYISSVLVRKRLDSSELVMCPKYRYRIFKGEVAEYAKQQLYSLCRQKDMVEVLELNILEDHIHLAASIPPKYPASDLMGN